MSDDNYPREGGRSSPVTPTPRPRQPTANTVGFLVPVRPLQVPASFQQAVQPSQFRLSVSNRVFTSSIQLASYLNSLPTTNDIKSALDEIENSITAATTFIDNCAYTIIETLRHNVKVCVNDAHFQLRYQDLFVHHRRETTRRNRVGQALSRLRTFASDDFIATVVNGQTTQSSTIYDRLSRPDARQQYSPVELMRRASDFRLQRLAGRTNTGDRNNINILPGDITRATDVPAKPLVYNAFSPGTNLVLTIQNPVGRTFSFWVDQEAIHWSNDQPVPILSDLQLAYQNHGRPHSTDSGVVTLPNTPAGPTVTSTQPGTVGTVTSTTGPTINTSQPGTVSTTSTSGPSGPNDSSQGPRDNSGSSASTPSLTPTSISSSSGSDSTLTPLPPRSPSPPRRRQDPTNVRPGRKRGRSPAHGPQDGPSNKPQRRRLVYQPEDGMLTAATVFKVLQCPPDQYTQSAPDPVHDTIPLTHATQKERRLWELIEYKTQGVPIRNQMFVLPQDEATLLQGLDVPTLSRMYTDIADAFITAGNDRTTHDATYLEGALDAVTLILYILNTVSVAKSSTAGPTDNTTTQPPNNGQNPPTTTTTTTQPPNNGQNPPTTNTTTTTTQPPNNGQNPPTTNTTTTTTTTQPLTVQMMYDAVSRHLNGGNSRRYGHAMRHGYSTFVDASSFRTLVYDQTHSGWLDDQVICTSILINIEDAVSTMPQGRNTRKFWLIIPQYSADLIQHLQNGDDDSARATIRLMNRPARGGWDILIPIHWGSSHQHWALGIIAWKERTLYYYDSLDTADHRRKAFQALRRLTTYLNAYRGQTWQESPDIGPQQTNGSDCGVLVLDAAINHIRGTARYPYDNDLRRRIAHQLYSSIIAG